ncbi:MAG: hypothetical protein ABGY24_01465, partial [bacterium]
MLRRQTDAVAADEVRLAPRPAGAAGTAGGAGTAVGALAGIGELAGTAGRAGVPLYGTLSVPTRARTSLGLALVAA